MKVLNLEFAGHDLIERAAYEGERSVGDPFGYVMVVLKNGAFFGQKGYSRDLFFDIINKAKSMFFSSFDDIEKYFIDKGLKKLSR